jgi:hypothetical protein
VATRAALSQDCERDAAEAFGGLGDDPHGIPAVTAVMGLIRAGKAFFDAGQNLVVIALQYEDRRAREEKLFEYLLSRELETAMVAALGRCVGDDALDEVGSAVADWATLDARSRVVKCIAVIEAKDSTRSPLHRDAVREALKWQIGGALVVPYERWMSIARAPTADRLGRLRLAHPQIHADLADFDDIRRRMAQTDDAQANLILGYRNLRRIAEGNLTEAEKARLLIDGIDLFVQGATAVGGAVNGIDDAGQKLREAFDAFRKALEAA